MRTAVFHAPGDVRLEDRDEPTPGPDEVKIRMRNRSTCGTDVKVYPDGTCKAQEDGLQMPARGGRLSAFGGLPKDEPDVTVEKALAMIASGEVPVLDLITHRLPLDRVHDAIDTVAGGAATKVTIEP